VAYRLSDYDPTDPGSDKGFRCVALPGK